MGVRVPPFAPITYGQLRICKFPTVPNFVPTPARGKQFPRTLDFQDVGTKGFSSRCLFSLAFVFTRSIASLC